MRASSTRQTIHVSRSADRTWTVTRITRLELSLDAVGWKHEVLGCAFQDRYDEKWRAYVPKWNDSGYDWHLLDGAKPRDDMNLAVLAILDRKERQQ